MGRLLRLGMPSGLFLLRLATSRSTCELAINCSAQEEVENEPQQQPVRQELVFKRQRSTLLTYSLFFSVAAFLFITTVAWFLSLGGGGEEGVIKIHSVTDSWRTNGH